MRNSMLKFMILTTVLVTGCGADLTTKHIARAKLRESSVTIIENLFDLTYVENHAIAFGFLSSIESPTRLPLIFALSATACIMMMTIVWRLKDKTIDLLIPFAILMAGAMGNIMDRAMNGYVTDFFHFYGDTWSFPVFNVADVLINIGLVLALLQIRKTDLLENTSS